MSLVLGIYVLEAQLRKLSRMNSTCSDKVDIRMVAIASISFTAVESSGGKSLLVELGLFCFILTINQLRNPSIARAPSVQTPTSFFHFKLLSKYVTATLNTSALVVVSGDLQTAFPLQLKKILQHEHWPMKRTNNYYWDNWTTAVLSSQRMAKMGDACIFLKSWNSLFIVSS